MIQYYNPDERQSLIRFTNSLRGLLEKHYSAGQDIVLVCIGSDRATGDCLGPIVGHKLKSYERFLKKISFHLYGTLEKPIHAKNLEATIQFIQLYHPDSLIIAVDASLGVMEHVGYITLSEGSLTPGVGVDKNLPAIGDICITGIVNLSGFGGQMLPDDPPPSGDAACRFYRIGPLPLSVNPFFTAPSCPPARGIRSSHQ